MMKPVESLGFLASERFSMDALFLKRLIFGTIRPDTGRAIRASHLCSTTPSAWLNASRD
jgi:hypothetical protein